MSTTDEELQEAVQEMPEELRRMLEPDSGVYVDSESLSDLALSTEPVPGVPGRWRLAGTGLRTVIEGREREEVDRDAPAEVVSGEGDSTEGYRPPWFDVDPVPRLAPFLASDGQTYLEPRPRHATRDAVPAPNLGYPYQTVGKVYTSEGGGSGVLVGRNLMITASHVAPWAGSSWWMEFIPGFRHPDVPAYGKSYVSQFRGVRKSEPSGLDIVVCRLYTPLGDALGWMGTQSMPEDHYDDRRYVSNGYPDTYGGRPAMESHIGVADIDGDGNGLEIEVYNHYQFSAGWSGGPLWYGPTGSPLCVGVLSGWEYDGYDPRRWVFAGGRQLTDLVRHGIAHWPV